MFSWFYGKQKTTKSGFVADKPKKLPVWQQKSDGTWFKMGSLMSRINPTNKSSSSKTFLEEVATDVATDVAATLIENTIESAIFPAEQGSVPAPDSLAKFLSELDISKSQLEKDLDKFEEMKKNFSVYDQSPHSTHFTQSCSGTNIKKLFAMFFENIKKGIKPAHDLIHQLIQDAELQINKGRDELAASYLVLNNEKLSHAEKCPEHITMCNRSISIIVNMIDLTDEIKKEINLCLNSQKITEIVAKQLLSFALHLITNLPLFNLTYSFEKPYRNFLSNEIKEEKEELRELVKTVKQELTDELATLAVELSKEPSFHDNNPNSLFKSKNETAIFSTTQSQPDMSRLIPT